ncbi:MAG: sugar ABC transporter ATP-binding protein [Synergistaceae bacterium]|jgi:ABC-type sugar transport system ATPase subunit|nr:sugar ABC transporter ATP-binding protein [Synergistaceae bacterium]
MPLLETRNLVKRFPGVLALDHFDAAFEAGEVHALVGENGAGKSTLVKILSGVYAPTSGEVLWEGRPVRFASPRDARGLMGVVHQERELIPHFTGYENLFLGLEHSAFGFLNRRRMEREAREFLERYQVRLDLSIPAHRLSSGQQEMLTVLKVLFHVTGGGPRAVIFDEPTAPLSVAECEVLFSLIETLKKDGRAVLYISHHLSEVLRVADRVTVMRNGAKAATVESANTSEDGLIRLMIAKDLENQYPKFPAEVGEVVFSAENFLVPGIRAVSEALEARIPRVSFLIRAGEIVGFAGLVGAGRTELAKSVFAGGFKDRRGVLRLKGREFHPKSAQDSIAQGVVMIPENRREEGLITDMDVGANLMLPSLGLHTRFGFVSGKKARAAAQGAVEKYGIRTFGLPQLVRTLSGGNQQKVSVGKWDLAQAALWIFDEPTQGIDVDAKTEIYSIMGRMATSGAGVWFISSELRELTAIADRIYVMKNGEIAAEYSRPYDRQAILDSMILDSEVRHGSERKNI